MDTLRDTESVVYNSRHLLQANSAVDVTSPFGNSAVEASNTGVRAALNIIYMSGFEKNRVQLMQIYALRLKRVPLDVYAGNINKLMFALGPAGSLGKLVHSLEPVGFESTPMLPPTNLALLQDDDPFVGTNITALLRMDSVFGDVYVNVLQCVLLKVANHTGLLTTEEVAQVLSKCETHVMSLGTREGVVMYLSTCAVSMEEMDTLHCNKLQGRLDLLPDLPAVEWGSVSDNETALYFQIHFDTLYREFAIDAVYDSYVRATVADILAVSVARVVHRPHLSEPETRARRLLQTNEATTSDVWVYPGSYVDPEDLLILFREQGGWRDRITTRLKSVMRHRSTTMGISIVGISRDFPYPPRPISLLSPSQTPQSRPFSIIPSASDYTTSGMETWVIAVIVILVTLVISGVSFTLYYISRQRMQNMSKGADDETPLMKQTREALFRKSREAVPETVVAPLSVLFARAKLGAYIWKLPEPHVFAT